MIGNKFAQFLMAAGLLIVSTVSSVGCAKSNYQESQNVETYAASCELRFTTNGLCVDLVWDKMQTDSEYGIITLKFYAKENPTVFVDPTNTPFVQLFMPSMGHGSSPTHVQKTSVGIYQVTNVFFSMPGNWDLRVQLKEGSKVIEQVIQKFNYTPFY
jgi:hypothetical protein